MKKAETDTSILKKNELEYQNNKYAKTLLNKEVQITTKESFEKKYLVPKEHGGKSRGVLFGKAVKTLLTNDIKGKKVLDCCCGRGHLAIYLAQLGAEVYGFDVSDNAIEVANYKAAVNNLKVDFRVLDAENLNYPDNYFDYIIGFEALHHIILYKNVPAELNRVLKKNGKAIFAENWGGENVILQKIRDPSLKKHDSSNRGEVILNNKLIFEKFQDSFKEINVIKFSLFYILKKRINSSVILKILRGIDKRLLRLFPSLSKFCGEAVIVLVK